MKKPTPQQIQKWGKPGDPAGRGNMVRENCAGVVEVTPATLKRNQARMTRDATGGRFTPGKGCW